MICVDFWTYRATGVGPREQRPSLCKVLSSLAQTTATLHIFMIIISFSVPLWTRDILFMDDLYLSAVRDLTRAAQSSVSEYSPDLNMNNKYKVKYFLFLQVIPIHIRPTTISSFRNSIKRFSRHLSTQFGVIDLRIMLMKHIPTMHRYK